ncbi:TrkH family potassium uptake protein [Spongorhabdus nitratireducens]
MSRFAYFSGQPTLSLHYVNTKALQTMSYKPVLYVLGLFLLQDSVVLCFPYFTALYLDDGSAGYFSYSLIVTFSLSLLVIFTCRPDKFELLPRQIFLMTNLCWLIAAAFGALPFFFHGLSYTDAFFEAMSGITTTGSTIYSNLSDKPASILLWRSILQWAGGIGFIVLAVGILPFLKVGGMRLFQSESSDWSDKALPRSGCIARRVTAVYFGMSVICMLIYWLAGMSLFEAVNHAMTTLSTGGFSTSDSSMGHFTNPLIHWNGTIFMLLGSLPFVLFVRVMRDNYHCGALFQDSQVRHFLLFMFIVWMILGFWLWMHSEYGWFEALTLVAFNTTSVVSTTGFALTDYSLWGPFASAVFFHLLFVGGCSGSTAGGIKIFRFEIGAGLLSLHLRKLTHPRACFVQMYNRQEINHEILRSLIAFCFFFALLIAMLTLALTLTGVDMMTSMTGAATAVANVGPGLGEIIGPAGNFEPLPDTAKWLLSLGMLMGRLEVITVLVLFTPGFWRK